MKLLLFLAPSLVASVSAQVPKPTATCQCPMVRCDASDPVQLCNCLNSRELLCDQVCPTYIPTYLPCPIKPPSTPTPAPLTTTCECEQVFCAQVWPASCYCGNAAKSACYTKCGGEAPLLQVCPPLSTPSIQVIPLAPASRTTTSRGLPILPSTPVPKPTGTHAPCGSGREGNSYCAPGYSCVKDPYRPGECGPACDGLGICVEEKMCGGFAGFSCQTAGQICWDDPRDDCDPKTGGADCGGLCFWPH